MLSLVSHLWLPFISVAWPHHGVMGDLNVNKLNIDDIGSVNDIKEESVQSYSPISGKSKNSDITQENFQAHLGGKENWYYTNFA